MRQYVDGLVSVIIPTYKRHEQLSRAISSVLNQSYSNLELILVNDNNPNDKVSQELYGLIKTVNDHRFHFLEQEKHTNGAVARNAGIRISKGEYVAFLDDDDYWMPNKLERQVEIMEKLDDSWGAVSTLIRYYRGTELTMATLPYKSGRIMSDILNRSIGLSTCTVMLRRNALDDTGYFDESLDRHQDIQLFAFLAQKYQIKLISEHLTCVDTKDAQNRPNSENILQMKRDFFESVAVLINSMPWGKRRLFYLMHDFETGYIYIKNGKKKKGYQMCIKILISPSASYRTIIRIIKRYVGEKFKSHILMKYNSNTIVT